MNQMENNMQMNLVEKSHLKMNHVEKLHKDMLPVKKNHMPQWITWKFTGKKRKLGVQEHIVWKNT